MSVVQLIFIWSMSFFIYFYKSYTSGMQTATSSSCYVWRVSTLDRGGTCFLRNWLELSTALRTFLIASFRFDASNVTSSPKSKCNGYIGSFLKKKHLPSSKICSYISPHKTAIFSSAEACSRALSSELLLCKDILFGRLYYISSTTGLSSSTFFSSSAIVQLAFFILNKLYL